jgi:signal transduction histidine kinase
MFQKYYFTGFGRELNGKKNIAVLMNQSPFIADAQQPISQVSLQIIKDHPLALEEGIIVTDNSFYYGYVSGLALMQATVEHMKATTQQLEETQSMLVQNEKMAYLGRLVAGVAHEINTPIGVALTAATSLEYKTKIFLEQTATGQIKRSEIHKYTESANSSVGFVVSNLERASNLVQSFKQTAVDQSTNETRHFNLCQYCKDLLLSLQPQIKKTPHRIEFDYAQEHTIYSSPGAISQILTNLVMNAITHAFDEKTSGIITICIQQQHEMIHLSVRDNGKGMEASVLEHIFAPFFTTMRGRGGTGLGLHIVYNLTTQLLQGTIKAKSLPGEGTEFMLVFPVKVQ